MRITIRPPRLEDIPAIARINRDNWKHSFKGVYSRQRIARNLNKWTPAFVARNLRRKNQHTYVAVSGKTIVGYITYAEKKDHVEIVATYVDRRYQRKGLGSRLLCFVERKTNARLYRLISASLPATVRFYDKHGYRKVRIMRRQHGDVDVVMKKTV